MRTSKQIAENGGLAAGSPDVTLPKVRDIASKGRALLVAEVIEHAIHNEPLRDHAARLVRDRLLRLATAAVNAYGGRVVKADDGKIVAVFPTADNAARAACVLMLEVDWTEPQGGIAPSMRVGLHAGTFTERAGEVSGDAVNIANGLAAKARPGQILTSSASADAVSPFVRRSARRLGTLDIYGRTEGLEVDEIGWRDGDGEDMPTAESTANAAPGTQIRLVLRLGTQEWTLGPESRQLTIGRDPCADIVVRSGRASRSHGIIEYREGGFFYTDNSLNGSFVSIGGTNESLVQRSQIALRGHGTICFGHVLSERGERLEFRREPEQH